MKIIICAVHCSLPLQFGFVKSENALVQCTGHACWSGPNVIESYHHTLWIKMHYMRLEMTNLKCQILMGIMWVLHFKDQVDRINCQIEYSRVKHWRSLLCVKRQAIVSLDSMLSYWVVAVIPELDASTEPAWHSVMDRVKLMSGPCFCGDTVAISGVIRAVLHIRAMCIQMGSYELWLSATKESTSSPRWGGWKRSRKALRIKKG